MTSTSKNQSRISSAATFGLAAVLSFGMNLLVVWLAYFQPSPYPRPPNTSLIFVALAINLVVVIWLAAVRKYALMAGIVTGLVAVPVAVLAFVAYEIRNFAGIS